MTTLTIEEENRLERVVREDLTVIEAAMMIGISERKCHRVKAQVFKDDAKGVVHGNRDRNF